MPDEKFTLNLKYISNAIKVSLVPTKTEKKAPQDKATTAPTSEQIANLAQSKIKQDEGEGEAPAADDAGPTGEREPGADAGEKP